jgi:hypothetical protein
MAALNVGSRIASMPSTTRCRSRVSSLSGTISEYRLKSGMSVGVLSLLPHLTNSGLFLSIPIPLVYTPITEHE